MFKSDWRIKAVKKDVEHFNSEKQFTDMKNKQ